MNIPTNELVDVLNDMNESSTSYHCNVDVKRQAIVCSLLAQAQELAPAGTQLMLICNVRADIEFFMRELRPFSIHLRIPSISTISLSNGITVYLFTIEEIINDTQCGYMFNDIYVCITTDVHSLSDVKNVIAKASKTLVINSVEHIIGIDDYYYL